MTECHGPEEKEYVKKKYGTDWTRTFYNCLDTCTKGRRKGSPKGNAEWLGIGLKGRLDLNGIREKKLESLLRRRTLNFHGKER